MAVGPAVRDIQLVLRELAGRLGRLNSAVASQVQLRGDDVELLDIVNLRGPLTPSKLAAISGFHPATLTGILDRLERGGWLARTRDPLDRRKILLEVLPQRSGELVTLYGPMSRSMANLCADYSPEELTLILGFLKQATRAGDDAVRTARVRSGHRSGEPGTIQS